MEKREMLVILGMYVEMNKPNSTSMRLYRFISKPSLRMRELNNVV